MPRDRRKHVGVACWENPIWSLQTWLLPWKARCLALHQIWNESRYSRYEGKPLNLLGPRVTNSLMSLLLNWTSGTVVFSTLTAAIHTPYRDSALRPFSVVLFLISLSKAMTWAVVTLEVAMSDVSTRLFRTVIPSGCGGWSHVTTALLSVMSITFTCIGWGAAAEKNEIHLSENIYSWNSDIFFTFWSRFDRHTSRRWGIGFTVVLLVLCLYTYLVLSVRKEALQPQWGYSCQQFVKGSLNSRHTILDSISINVTTVWAWRGIHWTAEGQVKRWRRSGAHDNCIALLCYWLCERSTTVTDNENWDNSRT